MTILAALLLIATIAYLGKSTLERSNNQLKPIRIKVEDEKRRR